MEGLKKPTKLTLWEDYVDHEGQIFNVENELCLASKDQLFDAKENLLHKFTPIHTSILRGKRETRRDLNLENNSMVLKKRRAKLRTIKNKFVIS